MLGPDRPDTDVGNENGARLLLGPGAVPRSVWRTQLRKFLVVQPTSQAIDPIAALCKLCPAVFQRYPNCRSRTPESFTGLFTIPSLELRFL